MKEEILKVIYEFFTSPPIFIFLLFSLFSICISVRIARELVEALEATGITINERGKKKWRNLISTLLGTIFITFVFLYLFAVLFPY